MHRPQRVRAMGPLRVSSQQRTALDAGWQMIALDAGSVIEPQHLPRDAWPAARSVDVPGTVAATLLAAGELPLHDGLDLDARDYWYRCVFRAPAHDGPMWLNFHGLATLAEVWLDRMPILSSDNMFLGHSVDVGDLLGLRSRDEHELLIRFASLADRLEQRHPRARWRTALIARRHLRFYRTTLLGRMPALPPHWAPVGPWRPLELVTEASPVQIEQVVLRPSLAGGDGVVHATVRVAIGGEVEFSAAQQAVLWVGDAVTSLERQETATHLEFSGVLRVPDVAIWWPHTHGVPQRYAARVELTGRHPTVIAELAPVGFRTVAVEQDAVVEFRLVVNGMPIYCRGVCWMPLDPASLGASPEELGSALKDLQSAGANMVRISGVTTYESDEFYSLCDELGILVWQDFMFASMDYPVEDDAFRRSIEQEARYQLERLGHRPCLAVLCGNSEVFQQPAMLGLPPETWQSDWFEVDLAAACRHFRPDTVYVSGSPSGGHLPFHPDSGVSHYFGVGAYRRPLYDARLGEPRFASECLAFATPPEPESLTNLAPADYDAGTPRDAGADWDFADVTAHYARIWFGDSAASLRESDPQRYLDVCRAAAGQTMAAVQQQWRRQGARCAGGLIWTGRDLVPGPGWGIVDCHGVPKSVYYYLKRAWAPVAVLVLDEGLNGLHVHLVNDRESPMEGILELRFMRLDGVTVQSAQESVAVGARSVTSMSVEAVVGSFVDSSHAYGFGPPAFDVLWAEFTAASEPMAEAVYLSAHIGLPPEQEVGLTAAVDRGSDGCWTLDVASKSFAHTVAIQLPGAKLSDNYFHLLPGQTKRVIAHWPEARVETSGELRALNARTPVKVEGP